MSPMRVRSGLLRLAAAALACAVMMPPCVAQTGLDLNGKAVNPLESAAGKVSVLIFVRTDCPVSNRYAPVIQKIGGEYAGRASFWLVYPDQAITPSDIRKYQQEFGYHFAGLRDPQHELVKLAHAEITPEAAVFDASGKLIYHGRIDNWYVAFGRTRSAPTTHELADAIQDALNGSQPAAASQPAVGCYISDLQ